MLTLQEEDFESEVKVVVVGNGCVGKTSMIKQFCKGQYSDEYKKTIGVDFLEKHQFVQALEEEVKLMLWDTAGQEQFHSITRSYYRGAKAAVLAFSTTDRESFNAIPLWKHKRFRLSCRKSTKVSPVSNSTLPPTLTGLYGLKYQVEEECGPIPMVLVQNKVDLLEEAVISR
uniref:Uncharacterized protein n=2 Tax=Physcomitrium patens TaxID=3218 RepID=A0A2K1LAZ8_PHYPA|nr:hypothetical protein PHYPA_001639 [Physcomitrium patens]